MMAYFFAGGKKVNYQEYKQLLNRELAKKVQREFDEFRKDILTKIRRKFMILRVRLS